MKSLRKNIAVFLAVIMLFTLLPSVTTASRPDVPSVHVFNGQGYRIEFHLNSAWREGYNAELRVYNTTSTPFYAWQLSMNRPMGLPADWINGGFVAYQNASETVIGYLCHNAPIPPGGSISLWLFGENTNGNVPIPTDFRLTPMSRRVVPVDDYTMSIARHNQWEPFQFNHAIVLQNISNRIIRGYEVEFEIAGGADITRVDIGNIVQTTSGAALITYTPGTHRSWHLGEVHHLGMTGTAHTASISIENVVVWERIAVQYGMWPDWTPPPVDWDNNNGGNNGNGGNGNNGGNNNGGDNDNNDNGGGEPPTPPRRFPRHGIPYEQTLLDLPNLIPPAINYVHVQALDFIRGIYRISISADDCTLDPRADPFFFWASPYGTFHDIVEYSYYAVSFTFKANPDTDGENISMMIAVGDNLGQTARRMVILPGYDNWDWQPYGQAIAFAPFYEPFCPALSAAFMDVELLAIATDDIGFSDVDSNHWAYSYINRMVYFDAVRGRTAYIFGPDDTIELRHFLAMVFRLVNINPPVATYGDGTERYTTFARIHGILPSFADENEPITREQAFYLIYRILTEHNSAVWTRIGNETPVFRLTTTFRDIGDLYDCADLRDIVEVLHLYGIITGSLYNDLFPQDTFTRAEAAMLLSRAVTPSTWIMMECTIERFFPHFSSFLVGVPSRDFLPREGFSYAFQLTEDGTFVFEFTALQSGLHTFTLSHNTAALVYSIQFSSPSLPNPAEFTAMYQVPVILDGVDLRRSQVTHYLRENERVLVGVRGMANSPIDFIISRL